MAGLNEEADVGVHEGDSHSDVLAIRQHSRAVGTALLDEAEDVVPSARRNKQMAEYDKTC